MIKLIAFLNTRNIFENEVKYGLYYIKKRKRSERCRFELAKHTTTRVKKSSVKDPHNKKSSIIEIISELKQSEIIADSEEIDKLVKIEGRKVSQIEQIEKILEK